jgi:hypothetical protein
MNAKKLIIVGGVVALGVYLYISKKKKDDEAKNKEKAPSVSKTIVTATQVEDSIKKDDIKKAESENIVEQKAPIKEAPIQMTTTTTKTIVGSVKLPPATIDTKIVGGVKPKLLMEFESPLIKNVYSSTIKTKIPNFLD